MSDQHRGEELFSAKAKAGSRTYFLDVQRAAELWASPPPTSPRFSEA